MKDYKLILPILLLFAISNLYAQNTERKPLMNENAPFTHYKNGNWIELSEDSYDISTQDRYSVKGVFISTKPYKIDTFIDLRGKYVFAPFGNAHTHSLADSYTGGRSKELYLDKGVFYGLNLTAPYTTARDLSDNYKLPSTVDVLFSHGGITAYKEGTQHPASVMEGSFKYIVPEEDKDKKWPLEGNAYWFMNSMEMINKKWKLLMHQNPDVVKIYLMMSGEKIIPGSECGYGLCPEIAKEIVKQAHKNSKLVFAHVNTAEDVKVAFNAGVDVLAHFPLGNDAIAYEDSQPYVLSNDLITGMGSKKMVVIPTASLLIKKLKTFRRDTLAQEIELQRKQIRKLDSANVQILLGTDGWNEDVNYEARYFDYYQIFNKSKILWMWSYATPQFLFPERKIGKLEAGYEASFIAFDDNIAEVGLENLKKPSIIIKQGEFIKLEE